MMWLFNMFKFIKRKNNYVDKEHLFYFKDIVTYNRNMKKILDMNLHLEYIEKDINKKDNKRFTYLHMWLSDNGRTIDENNEIKLWLTLSKRLTKVYNKLNLIKSHSIYASYNIRLLQGYIINIVEIRKLLD